MTDEEAELFKKEMQDSLTELNRLRGRQDVAQALWINDLLERSERAIKYAQTVIKSVPDWRS
jgi:hypothetical protein